jgi:addiction module RelE/StbE family toxin
MRIRWTTPAAEDLEGIVKYIRQDNPTAAREVARTILDSISTLARYPHTGRPGDNPDTRELVIRRFPACIVVYHVGKDAVEIWHVWHGAQDWPRQEERSH